MTEWVYEVETYCNDAEKWQVFKEAICWTYPDQRQSTGSSLGMKTCLVGPP